MVDISRVGNGIIWWNWWNRHVERMLGGAATAASVVTLVLARKQQSPAK